MAGATFYTQNARLVSSSERTPLRRKVYVLLGAKLIWDGAEAALLDPLHRPNWVPRRPSVPGNLDKFHRIGAKEGDNGLTFGNPRWAKRVVCDAEDSLRRAGLLGASGEVLNCPHGRGFWRKSPLLALKAIPVLGVSNSNTKTVGAKMPKIISRSQPFDALILGVVDVRLRGHCSLLLEENPSPPILAIVPKRSKYPQWGNSAIQHYTHMHSVR